MINLKKKILQYASMMLLTSVILGIGVTMKENSAINVSAAGDYELSLDWIDEVCYASNGTSRERITEVEFLSSADLLSDGYYNSISVGSGVNAYLYRLPDLSSSNNYQDKVIIRSDGEFVYTPVDSSDLFSRLYVLRSINFNGVINTSRTTIMTEMFEDCKKLVKLDLSDFNTSSVTDMEGMFSSMHMLHSVDLTSFNTKNVKNMSSMFKNLNHLKKLDLSNFEIASDLSSSVMFLYSSIDEIVAPNTIAATKSLYLPCPVGGKPVYYDVNNRAMSYSYLDINTVGKTIVLNATVEDDKNTLPHSWVYLDEVHATDVNEIRFLNKHSAAPTGYNSKIITENITAYYNETKVFFRTTEEKIYLPKKTGSFFGHLNARTIHFNSVLDTSKTTALAGLFEESINLYNIDTETLNVSNVYKFDHMFYNTSSLASVNLSTWDVSSGEYFQEMFDNSGIKILDLSRVVFGGNIKYTTGMISGANKLMILMLPAFFPDVLLPHTMFELANESVKYTSITTATNAGQKLYTYVGYGFELVMPYIMSIEYHLYRESDVEHIETLILELEQAITVANSIAVIDEAFNTFKTKVESLLTDAEHLVKELATAKVTAIKNLNEYVKLTDYRSNEQNTITTIINEATLKINNAATTEEVDAELSTAQGLIDAVPTDDKLTEMENLKATKIAAIKNLNEYVELTDYRSNEQNTITTIINEATLKINNAATTEEVNVELLAAQGLIDAVPTDVELTDAENLSAAKVTAIKDLNEYVELTDYRSNEQSTITTIINEATLKINNAATTEEVNVELLAAQGLIDVVPTDEELTDAENLSAAKVTAIENLNEYADVGYYKPEQIKIINSIIDEGIIKINNATTIEEVDAELKAAQGLIDAVPTGPEVDAEILAQTKVNAKNYLDSYVDFSDYRKTQQEEIKAIIDEAKWSINGALTVAIVEYVVSNTIEEIDAVLTHEELIVIEFEKAKEDAIEELREYYNEDDYRNDEQEIIQSAILEAISEINSATSLEQINEIVKHTKEDIDKVKLASIYESEELVVGLSVGIPLGIVILLFSMLLLNKYSIITLAFINNVKVLKFFHSNK